MPGPVASDINARFDSKTEPGPNGCLLWTAAKDKDGYGLFQVSGRVTKRAHRWAYERAYGAIQTGRMVRHTCDNPSCVAIEHMLLGTALDNMRDMKERKRDSGRRGERHYAARLTSAQVIELRARHVAGESAYSLAKVYGISYSQAKAICAGRKWADP